MICCRKQLAVCKVWHGQDVNMFKIHSMKFSNVNKNQPRTGPRKKMYNIEKDK